jgi:hypothetical protein
MAGPAAARAMGGANTEPNDKAVSKQTLVNWFFIDLISWIHDWLSRPRTGGLTKKSQRGGAATKGPRLWRSSAAEFPQLCGVEMNGIQLFSTRGNGNKLWSCVAYFKLFVTGNLPIAEPSIADLSIADYGLRIADCQY